MLARAKPALNSSQGPVPGLILAPRPTDCQDDENQRFPGLSCSRSRPPSALVLELSIDRCNHGSSTSAPAINTRPIRAGLGPPDKRNRRVSRLWRHGDKMLPASTCSANNLGPRPLTQPSRLASSWTVSSTLHPGPRHGLLAHHLSFHAATCGKACPFPRPSSSHVTSGSGGWTNPRFSLG